MRLGHRAAFGFVILFTVSWVGAATWSVDQNDSGCGDSACTPCCTIQGAVNKCFGGDIVSIEPGTYVEQVDIRGMYVMGNITLMAADGPGTVLVAPTSGHTLRHGDSHTNTVNVEGVDFTSADGFACVYLDHQGNVFLRDVTVDNCGYTAFVLDNTGQVIMERCTATNSDQSGIQVDGASYASLTDCTANSNPDTGIGVYSLSNIVLINPTAVGNDYEGISVNAVAPTTISGATVTDNGRNGIYVASSSTVSITSSTITGSFDQGIDIEGYNSDPVDGVILADVDVNNNGIGGVEVGVRLRDIVGSAVVTNCNFDDNGEDGLSVYETVVGDIEIYGGHANGNGDDGYDLSATGNATVIGVVANTNDDQGVELDMPGKVYFQDCTANDNLRGAGFDLQWWEPDTLDGVSVFNCIANNNGLGDGGNGIYIQHVVGPVTVAETTTNGNSRTGVRVDSTVGSVLVRDAVSNSGLEEGIKIDADVGPVLVKGCQVRENALEGIRINGEDATVASINIARNALIDNDGTGVALFDLAGAGPFKTRCNDISGNDTGVYLNSPVTVNARQDWWGDVTGPSGPGAFGSGDSFYFESGGAILFDPWMPQSALLPSSACPAFDAGFETGTLGEWHIVRE